MTNPITTARAEVFRLWIEAADETEARAKALSWAIAEPNLREPRVVAAEPRDGTSYVWNVEVHAVVAIATAPGWYRLPTLPGDRLDLLTFEAELEAILDRYQLGGRKAPLAGDVVDAVRRYIGKGGAT